jgi:hypothetical protein
MGATMTTTSNDKGDTMSANNPLPKHLEKLTRQPRLPWGDEVFALLRQWYPYAPASTNLGSVVHKEQHFLRWLIAGRVIRVLQELDRSDQKIDHQIAASIREFGRRDLPMGCPGIGKAQALGLFGWIGVEMGNPTWPRRLGIPIACENTREGRGGLEHD